VPENLRNGEGVSARTSTVNSCSVPWLAFLNWDDCRYASGALQLAFCPV
jgi:hypothetical protein